MEEKSFFEQGGVKVTNARFIVNNQTYAMNGVTSVKSGETKPSRTGPIIVAVLGLGGLLSGSTGGVIVGLLLIAGAVYWWMQQKPTLTVLLSSSSGEAKALSSQDAPYINGVIAALNNALIHRG